MTRAQKIIVAVVALIIVPIFVRKFFVEAYRIPSAAMSPTLIPGDRVFANKLLRGKRPLRGDVIIFPFPEARDEDFVFRVIGLPGDRVELRAGRIVLNGKTIPRCALGRTSIEEVGAHVDVELFVEELDGRRYLTQYSLASAARTDAGPWTVAENEAFVLGDNRNNARDSREWWNQKGGGVPFADIRGRVGKVWLSAQEGKGSDSERVGLDLLGPPRLPSALSTLRQSLETCLGPQGKYE